MPGETPRSRAARSAAERALIRVVHHYGSRPEFVLLGGLMPELLCAGSEFRHAGTTDVDVQVDLEIACGTVNVVRLERALRNAEFEPDTNRVWRWRNDGGGSTAVVRFELLADLDHVPAEATLTFDGCDALGAVNLRGTGFASRDVAVHELTARVGGDLRRAEINVAGLAGFLLAKTAAARSRRLPKDGYDIAFVLLHNDAGGPEAAARAVLRRFGTEIVGATLTALNELVANFATVDAQGPPVVRRPDARGPPRPRSCHARNRALATHHHVGRPLEEPALRRRQRLSQVRHPAPPFPRWAEVAEVWNVRASLLIYQHFRRVERKAFLTGLGHEFRERLGAADVGALVTAHVAFFLSSRSRPTRRGCWNAQRARRKP